MNDSKLIKLVDAGDFICIERGKLIYRPAKRAVRSYSRVNDRRNLVAEVLRAVGQTGYEYCGYSTGNYGPGGYSGVSLQFLNLVTSESAYVVFNAKLERQRNTRSGKKGQRLPDGRFIVGRKSAFTKFWLNCGLELPRSLTSFHDYMGKLSQVFIIGGGDS